LNHLVHGTLWEHYFMVHVCPSVCYQILGYITPTVYDGYSKILTPTLSIA